MNRRSLAVFTALALFVLGMFVGTNAADLMNMTMGPMNMSGTVKMNGKDHDMTCSMKPIGKPKTMKMDMDAPMNMSGTMTMMGQKYNCSMKMTPKN